VDVRTPSISDSNLLTTLGVIVSRFGVEGASLSRLSEASGLKRASLYHRFPGGKDEIVSSVVDHTVSEFNQALAPAFSDAAPATRVRQVADAIGKYYEHGNRSCLIIALSLSDDDGRNGAGRCVDGWSSAFENIAVDSGMKKSEAKAAALDAVAAIEGALVVSATTGNRDPFKRSLKSLPDRLLAT